MPARSVGDGPHSDVGTVDPGVFVVFSFGARVGGGPGANPTRDHDALSVGARWPSMDAKRAASGKAGSDKRDASTRGPPSVHQTLPVSPETVVDGGGTGGISPS